MARVTSKPSSKSKSTSKSRPPEYPHKEDSNLKKLKDVDDSNVNPMVSKIERDYRRLMKKLSDPSKENAQRDLIRLKYLLKSSNDLLPLALKDYVKSRRGMYAYISLSNQIRELMVDIRQLDDVDTVMGHVLESILKPALKLILSHVIQDFSSLKNEMDDLLPPKRAMRMKKRLNEMLTSHGALLNEASSMVEKQMTEYMKS